MHRIAALAFAMIVLSCYNLLAQRTIEFHDSFDNNDNEWFTGESDDDAFSAEIDDGIYTLEHTAESGFRYTYQTVELPKARNFSIKMRMRVVEAANESLAGFVYNGEDASNIYVFASAPGGQATVFRYKEGEVNWIEELETVEGAKGIGKWMDYELKRENDAVACYVNGKYVGGYSYSYYLVYGGILGIYVEGKSKIEIDDIEVASWPMNVIDLAQGAVANATPVSLGMSVNTTADELVDCISPDGSILVFSRNYDPNNIGDSTARDIWITTKQADGSWEMARNIGAPLNTAGHNYAIAMTQDLNTLFVQGVYNSDGTSTTSTGISESNRTRNGWSMPKPLLIDDYYNNGTTVNSHITPDGQVLVMSLERNDSKGGNDMYVCFRTSSGWTAPKHMGNEINTIGMDMGPFIAADGKTMYFSTNGLPGYEGRDIFVTVRQDETWLNWSKPKNLGKPINTDEHDTFFQAPASGEVGYYSSTKESVGRSDIFSIMLPTSARPDPVVMARGRVLDAETRKPIEAGVVYEDLTTNQRVGEATSSPVDGAYRVALGKGRLFGVHAEAPGYYPLSEQFDARNLDSYAEVTKDLLLTPVKINASIRLNNVFFDQGKYDLRPESFAELDRLVEFLTTNASTEIELGGHTDNVGSDNDNRTLSQNRVNSVMAYVVGHGISQSRLTAKGFGESKPVSTNDTEEGRQLNRRVEFTILKK